MPTLSPAVPAPVDFGETRRDKAFRRGTILLVAAALLAVVLALAI